MPFYTYKNNLTGTEHEFILPYQHEIPKDNVTVLGMPPRDMINSLDNGEIDGFVEFGEDKKGQRQIIIRSPSGMMREYAIPHGKHPNVYKGDRVFAGQQLTDGPVVPHDILRVQPRGNISGETLAPGSFGQRFHQGGRPEDGKIPGQLPSPARHHR